jgi:murein DD-endopeptidase MepM/ murein hydrolase activator NlpD
MSKVGPRPVNSFVRRKPARRIIIASGDKVRTIVFRPWLAATLTAVGIAFFALYLAATGYLVFRDDLLAASIARQARIQHAYEDRIASLRADIDRLTSRQLLNQQAFEEKLEKLLGRQAALDARQDVIAGLSQAARRAGLTPPTDLVPTPAANPLAPAESAAGGPLITGSIGTLKSGHRAPLAIAMLRPSSDEEPVIATPDHRIAAVEDSLDELAYEQVAYVEQVAGKVGERASRISNILKKLGHPVPAATTGEASEVGGPFVPLAANADPETFRSNVQIITAEIERLAQVKSLANQLPLTKPVASSAITSRFGTRLDPFLRRPALHTGVDFRAPKGYPVHSTAAGTVVTAEYSGGYGKMVEIDHGNGVSTRYGHLSRISVKAGDTVGKGVIVGRAGSTGRSTGPHVHYEVRIDGEPIDPMRYIRAGGEIGSLL